MRAYRPSRRGGENYDDDFREEKEQKMQVYARRAQAGLPLFEPMTSASPVRSEVLASLSLSH